MKRAGVWVIGLGLVGFAVVMSCQAKERKPQPAPEPQAAQPAPQPPPVFTFAGEDDMKEFAKMWQQRQAALVRQNVLQGYWNQEQEAVQHITEELISRYHVDVAKAYTLDIARKALVEVERKEEPAPAGGADVAPDQGAKLGQVPAPAQPASTAK